MSTCQLKKTGYLDRISLYALVTWFHDSSTGALFEEAGKRCTWVTPPKLWLPALAYQREILFLIHYGTLFHSLARATGHKYYKNMTLD